MGFGAGLDRSSHPLVSGVNTNAPWRRLETEEHQLAQAAHHSPIASAPRGAPTGEMFVGFPNDFPSRRS